MCNAAMAPVDDSLIFFDQRAAREGDDQWGPSFRHCTVPLFTNDPAVQGVEEQVADPTPVSVAPELTVTVLFTVKLYPLKSKVPLVIVKFCPLAVHCIFDASDKAPPDLFTV